MAGPGTPARPSLVATVVLACALGGCATRSGDVQPLPANPAEFAAWSCERIDDESEQVQRRAADVAYAVDERGGNNVVALGVGLAVFWPAILAMRPEGLEAEELARLKGRYEALAEAARRQGCPPASELLPPARAAALPVAPGERLVYEERNGPRRVQPAETALQVSALRRGEIEYRVGNAVLRHDRAGNVVAAPPGMLKWPQLLRGELALGQVIAGTMVVSGGDPYARARLRGQVVAVGPQMVNGRRFDAAVIELFGDVQRGEASATRVDGALVVDRGSGVLLRLDLNSAEPGFDVHRRLMRVDPPG